MAEIPDELVPIFRRHAQRLVDGESGKVLEVVALERWLREEPGVSRAVPAPTPLKDAGAFTFARESETSRKAAILAWPTGTTRRRQIVDYLWAMFPTARSRKQIAHALGMNENTVRPRVRELIDGGWVYVTGKTPGISGPAEEILSITTAGGNELAREERRRVG